ncbi:hypothetical protein [Antarctobacter sp.]|uniref:hypothetical protein n=1 Tax=Antarctobacter sp. TaxID=1872577 RepID=UPI003A8C9217
MLRLIFGVLSIFTLPAQIAKMRITGLAKIACAVQTAAPETGSSVHMSGEFEPGGCAAVARALTEPIGNWRKPGHDGRAFICLTNPGEFFPTALILGEMLRRAAVCTTPEHLRSGAFCRPRRSL